MKCDGLVAPTWMKIQKEVESRKAVHPHLAIGSMRWLHATSVKVSEEDGIPVVPATSTTSSISCGTSHGRLGLLPCGCRQRCCQKGQDRTGL